MNVFHIDRQTDGHEYGLALAMLVVKGGPELVVELAARIVASLRLIFSSPILAAFFFITHLHYCRHYYY